MRFPPEFINRLKHHLPLSEVVGRRVPIKRHGREFQGLCPFHKEKSPSFTVNDDKGFFHCFGCGAHGDAIGFIKDYERVEYREAVERLAAEAGLEVPRMTRETQETERRRHTLEDAVAMAERWFTEKLYGEEGQAARAYLRTRGVKKSVADSFGLGFAPASRDGLKGALMKQGVPEAMLIEAGLLGKPEDGASYDRFRARLIFPIRNAQGKTVAFGGRILPQAKQDNVAKYLNSPETPLFHKGEMLFAYDIARKAVRDNEPLIVAEGYMDVIALHQAGFTGAVAPLGTAVTEAQLNLLWRVSSEPVMCLDGDAAGRRAALRAMELALPLLAPDRSLKFALLPSGEDPDSVIRKDGREAMARIAADAKILSQALWESALQQFGTQTPERRAALEQYLRNATGRVANDIVRRHLQRGFDSSLYALGFRRPKKGSPAEAFAVPLPPDTADGSGQLKRLENQLMLLLLLHPEFSHHADIEEQFSHMDFAQPELDKLRKDILEINGYQEVTNSAALRQLLADRGHNETMETVLHSASHTLPKQTYTQWETQPAAALAAWRITSESIAELWMEREIAVLAQDDSEDAYQRIAALNKQKELNRRNRYSVTSDEQAS